MTTALLGRTASTDVAGRTSQLTPADRGIVRAALSGLECPFPSAVHPAAQSIEEGTIAWMKRHGFVRTRSQEDAARDAAFGMRAARVHPSGDAAAIQLASDLTVWLFHSDDEYVEAAGASGMLSETTSHAIRCLRVLRDPQDLPHAAGRSLLALQDISRRLRQFTSEEQFDRLVGGMVEFFLAGCCEAASFSRRRLPGVADYVPVRDAINCLRSVCFVFIEIVGGYALPADLWHRPAVQALVRKATRIVSNHHDLLSGVRELANDMPMNLPAVTAREQGLPIGQAFAQVVALANADTRDFVAMADRVLTVETNRFVRLYVEGLKAWIRGNLDWSATTGRYRVAHHLWR